VVWLTSCRLLRGFHGVFSSGKCFTPLMPSEDTPAIADATTMVADEHNGTYQTPNK
jgi:hypothetical protein